MPQDFSQSGTLVEDAPDFSSAGEPAGLDFSAQGELVAPSQFTEPGRALARGALQAEVTARGFRQRGLEEKVRRQLPFLVTDPDPWASGPEETGVIGPNPKRVAAETQAQANASKLAAAQSAAQLVPRSQAVQEWEAADESNWFGVLARNPIEIASTIMLESLPQSMVGLAGGAALGAEFGPGGAAVGAGLGSLAVEYGSSLVQSAGEAGFDLRDPNQVRAAFADPEALAKWKVKAIRRGIPIAIFDGATFGLAGRFLGPALGRGAKAVTKAVAKEAGLQALGGMAGETYGQLATGGEVKWKDIAAEGIAELVGAPVEVASNLRTDARRRAGGTGESANGRVGEPARPAPVIAPVVNGEVNPYFEPGEEVVIQGPQPGETVPVLDPVTLQPTGETAVVGETGSGRMGEPATTAETPPPSMQPGAGIVAPASIGNDKVGQPEGRVPISPAAEERGLQPAPTIPQPEGRVPKRRRKAKSMGGVDREWDLIDEIEGAVGQLDPAQIREYNPDWRPDKDIKHLFKGGGVRADQAIRGLTDAGPMFGLDPDTKPDALGNALNQASANRRDALARAKQPLADSPTRPLAASPAAGLIAGSAVDQWADGVIEERGASSGSMNALDPELLAAYAVKGAALIEQGITDFAQWSAAMVKQLPALAQWSAEQLRAVYQQAQAQRGGEMKEGLPRLNKTGEYQSMLRVHPDHQRLAELGLGYGVTWKGRNYGKNDWKIGDAVQTAIDLSQRNADEFAVSADNPLVLEVAFGAVRQAGNKAPDAGLVRRLFEQRLQGDVEAKIQATRSKLLARERPEAMTKLREYRAGQRFKMFNPERARKNGYAIDEVAPGVPEEDAFTNELTPTTQAAWVHPTTGNVLYKVEGYTEPPLGSIGQMVDDPYDGPMDGAHSKDTKFIELARGDKRNPDQIWADYRTEVKRLENEVAGDFNQLAAASRGQLFTDTITSALDRAIEATRPDLGGLQEGVTGAPVWVTKAAANAVLRIVRAAYQGGKALAQAVAEGVEWLRGQNLPGFNADEAASWLTSEIGNRKSEIEERKLFPRLMQDPSITLDVRERISNRFYEVQDHQSAEAAAIQIAQEFGPEAAADLALNPPNNELAGQVGWFAAAAMHRAAELERAAGSPQDKARWRQWGGAFGNEILERATTFGRAVDSLKAFSYATPEMAVITAQRLLASASERHLARYRTLLDAARQALATAHQQATTETFTAPGVVSATNTAMADAVANSEETRQAIRLEASNTLEMLPSVMRQTQAAILRRWHALEDSELVRSMARRAGQGIENSIWAAVKKAGGSQASVQKVMAQLNRALSEQVNRALGVAKEQFNNPQTFLMRLQTVLANGEQMSRIWQATRENVARNLAEIDTMRNLMKRIRHEIEALTEQKRKPAPGLPITAIDPKLRAIQAKVNAAGEAQRIKNIDQQIEERFKRIEDVRAQLAEYERMAPAWQAVLALEVDVWGPGLLRGVLRETMKAEGVKLQQLVADHYRGLSGVDPVAVLATLKDKIIAATGLDPAAADRLAKDLEKEYMAQVEAIRKRVAQAIAEQQKRAAQRKAEQPTRTAEQIVSSFAKTQSDTPSWAAAAAPDAVRAAVRDQLRTRSMTEDEFSTRLQALGVKPEPADRLARVVRREMDIQDQVAANGGSHPLDGVIRQQLRTLGTSLRQAVKQGQVNGQQLGEAIVQTSGLQGPAADRLREAINRRFEQLATAAKRKELQAILDREGPDAPARARRLANWERAIELTNLSPDAAAFQQGAAAVFGFKHLTPEQAARIRAAVNALQAIPEDQGQRRAAATQRLMEEIGRLTEHWLSLPMAVWFTNAISGITTQELNIKASILNFAVEWAVALRYGPAAFSQATGAAARSIPRGVLEAVQMLRTGVPPVTKFGENKLPDPHRLEDLRGWERIAILQKYVSRLVRAADLPFYFAGRDLKAVLLARGLQRKQGLTGGALTQAVADELHGTRAQRTAARTQAASEGYKGLAARQRVHEIMERNVPSEVKGRASDFGLGVTFNNDTYGFFGGLAEGVNWTAGWLDRQDLHAAGALTRTTLPFARLISNVMNRYWHLSPLGLITAGRAHTRFNRGKEVILYGYHASKDDIIDQYVRATAGTVLMTLAYAVAFAHKDDDEPELTFHGTGPRSKTKRDVLKDEGWIPNSLQVGRQFISLEPFPNAAPLAWIGQMLDGYRYGEMEEQDIWRRAAWSGFELRDVMLDRSFMSGLSDIMRPARSPKDAGRQMESGLARTATTFVVPNLFKHLDRLGDPKVYDAPGLAGSFMEQTPYARREGKPLLNWRGQPIVVPIHQRFYSERKLDTIGRELARLDVGVLPGAPMTWQGKTLTDVQQYEVVKLSGPAIERGLGPLFADPYYRSAPDEDQRGTGKGKREMVQALIERQRKLAKAAIIGADAGR